MSDSDRNKTKLYPCCDDPNCAYCFGEGVYEEDDGWLERLEAELELQDYEASLSEYNARVLIDEGIALPTNILEGPGDGNLSKLNVKPTNLSDDIDEWTPVVDTPEDEIPF